MIINNFSLLANHDLFLLGKTYLILFIDRYKDKGDGTNSRYDINMHKPENLLLEWPLFKWWVTDFVFFSPNIDSFDTKSDWFSKAKDKSRIYIASNPCTKTDSLEESIASLSNSKNTQYLIDIDNRDPKYFSKIRTFVELEALDSGGEILGTYETPNGYHIIVDDFIPNNFIYEFPEIYIHKHSHGNMLLLYYRDDSK